MVTNLNVIHIRNYYFLGIQIVLSYDLNTRLIYLLLKLFWSREIIFKNLEFRCVRYLVSIFWIPTSDLTRLNWWS